MIKERENGRKREKTYVSYFRNAFMYYLDDFLELDAIQFADRLTQVFLLFEA